MDNSEVVKEKEENEAVPVAKGGKGLEENDPELDQLLDCKLPVEHHSSTNQNDL
jgi:hypothetical protein